MNQKSLFQTATSSQHDTRASHSVLLGSAKAQKMTATSGRTSLELLHKKDPLGVFSRMFMVTSQWASTRCWLTWKLKATPQGRLLFQLAASMPRTNEKDSGSSPEIWRTPQAANATQGPKSPEHFHKVMKTGESQITLTDQVRMWPTPRASEYKDCGPVGSKSHTHMAKKQYLCAAVKTWPTPTANEHHAGLPGGNMQAMLGNHPEVRGSTPEEWKRGTLNPTWVEWLMGYPEGWTDLNH